MLTIQHRNIATVVMQGTRVDSQICKLNMRNFWPLVRVEDCLPPPLPITGRLKAERLTNIFGGQWLLAYIEMDTRITVTETSRTIHTVKNIFWRPGESRDTPVVDMIQSKTDRAR